jgi:peptidoglycan/xylan/chitin deacetylase (PgdA/CDA1 family)
MKMRPVFVSGIFVSALIAALSSGCSQSESASSRATPPTNEPAASASKENSATSPAETATAVESDGVPASGQTSPPATASSVPANEAGLIPVLEYHRIVKKAGIYDRSPAAFRKDLDRLYKERYRPVALQDVLAGNIDLPAGLSPVILTFDDADATQFRYKPDGTLDPDCAVAILQEFEQKHPDWKTKATFYVLPESAFGPAKQRPEKLRILRDEMGLEIGNHTVTHGSLKRMTDAQVQKEIGGAVQKINAYLPDTKVESIALPMGISPKNKALLKSGTYNGTTYANKAVMLVGANPGPSPFSKKFDPMAWPRIQAVEGPSGSTYWLDKLKKPGVRYVSDGDPKVVTVPKSEEKNIASERLGEKQVVVRDEAGGATAAEKVAHGGG